MNEIDIIENARSCCRVRFRKRLRGHTEAGVGQLGARLGFGQTIQSSILAVQIGHVAADGLGIRTAEREVHEVWCELPACNAGIGRQISLEPVGQPDKVELLDALVQQRVGRLCIESSHRLGSHL